MKPKGTLKSDKLPSPPIVDWMLKHIEASMGAPGALAAPVILKKSAWVTATGSVMSSTPCSHVVMDEADEAPDLGPLIDTYLDKRLGRPWESERKPRKKKRAVQPYKSDGTATPLPETEEVIL